MKRSTAPLESRIGISPERKLAAALHIIDCLILLKETGSTLGASNSCGAFADSLAVFAIPKPIGLKSNMQLWGVLVKSFSIT
jgi:hypothetical protein